MKKILCIVFMTLLFGLLVLTLALPSRSFSAMENRVLSTRPPFTLSGALSGQWMDDVELWLADQFPGRTFFVRSKTSLNYLLGQREIGGVYIGSDGQLFEVQAVDEEQFSKNAAELWAFAQQHDFVFLPIYSAFTLYPERLPAFAQEPDERALLDELNLPSRIPVIDVYDALLADRDEPIYYRTDHHWTQRGALTAYRALCGVLNLTPVEPETILTAEQPFYGSLFSKAPLWGLDGDENFLYPIDAQVTVRYDLDDTAVADSPYTLSALEEKDQYTVFLDGNHARVDIRTDAGSGRTLIVLKDSFAHALLPLLASHYDTLIAIDLRYYNMPLSGLLSEYPDADVLVTYNLSWLANDKTLFKLNR